MKKRIFSMIMMLFLAFTVFLTGCKEEGLKDNPKTDATIYSNGGMSVIKGDYLYFVNGYVDSTTLTKDDNKSGKVTKSAIYRTKLDNGEIQKDQDGFLKNADRVVSKVVGFANGGFSIIDDYIFYATPYMKLSSDGTLQSNRVEFHKVGIDGTGDKVIYVTSVEEAKLDWSVFKIDGNYYLVVYENSKIVSVNALSGDVVGAVENATSYAILDEDTYVYADERNATNQNFVYYTRSVMTTDGVTTNNYSGNAVCTFNIATGETKALELSTTNTYTIKHVTKDTVYYTYTNVGITEACLYKKVISNSWSDATEVKLTNSAYDNYYFVDYGNDLIIASADSSLWRLEGGASVTPVELTTSRDIVGIFGDYAYYISDNKLIRVNIHTGDLEDAYGDKSSTIVTNSNFIDFDNRRIYVYNNYTAENGETNYYLNYFEEDFENSEFKQRFVGVFESNDIPEKPEQPESEYEGDEVEYVPHID